MSSSENKVQNTFPDVIGPDHQDNSGPYYVTAAQYYGRQTDWQSLHQHTRNEIATYEHYQSSAWGNTGNVNMSDTPFSSVSTAVLPAVGQSQSTLLPGSPGLAPGVVAPQQPPTTAAQPAARVYRRRDPNPPMNATITDGARGGSRYITTVARSNSRPNLEAPGMACTDPACSCSKAVWPTSGVLTILPCGIVCEVCGLSRNDFGVSTSNLRRHVREHHLLTSAIGGSAGQTRPARLYNDVAKER